MWQYLFYTMAGLLILSAVNRSPHACTFGMQTHTCPASSLMAMGAARIDMGFDPADSELSAGQAYIPAWL